MITCFFFNFAIDSMVGRMETYTVYFISWCSLQRNFERGILDISTLIPAVQKQNTLPTTKIKKNQNPNKTKRKKHLIIKIKMENNDLFFLSTLKRS